MLHAWDLAVTAVVEDREATREILDHQQDS
jgi:hypothetical protein